MTQPVKMILAVDLNNSIGVQGINELPWYLPEDLKHFKKLTNTHSIIMGFNTYSSLPRMLPNRIHLVVSREKMSELPPETDVFYHCRSIETAIQKARDLGTEVFIIGGGMVYNYCLENDLIDEIYLTRVNYELLGPNLSFVDLSRLKSDFKINSNEASLNGECSFLHYVKTQPERESL
jgi:dihydrofolate reductase